jgi:hypothetical protein
VSARVRAIEEPGGARESHLVGFGRLKDERDCEREERRGRDQGGGRRSPHS